MLKAVNQHNISNITNNRRFARLLPGMSELDGNVKRAILGDWKSMVCAMVRIQQKLQFLASLVFQKDPFAPSLGWYSVFWKMLKTYNSCWYFIWLLRYILHFYEQYFLPKFDMHVKVESVISCSLHNCNIEIRIQEQNYFTVFSSSDPPRAVFCQSWLLLDCGRRYAGVQSLLAGATPRAPAHRLCFPFLWYYQRYWPHTGWCFFLLLQFIGRCWSFFHSAEFFNVCRQKHIFCWQWSSSSQVRAFVPC